MSLKIVLVKNKGTWKIQPTPLPTPRQVFSKKEIWPRLVLKKLPNDQLNLTHPWPYQCKKCPQRFHKIHEATLHYLSSHQHDLPKKEILENEEIGGFDLIKIEEADINFDKGQLENDHLVNIQNVPNKVVLLD